MHKQISDIKLGGFAASSAAAGETVKILVKGWATSQSPMFFVYAEQIANIIFPKLGISNIRDVINSFLAIIHTDDTADIYIQNFVMMAKVKPNRSVKAGETIYARDVDDIAEVRFPDISIKPDDKVIFIERNGWRFGIFFDFTKEVNEDALAVDIAELHKRLVLEDVLKNVLAEIQSKRVEAEAFVITEGKTDWRHLEKAFEKIGYSRKLDYSKQEKSLGDSGLLEICRRAIHLPPNKLRIICVFDRDNPKTIRELDSQSSASETDFQSWDNNVFSMILPRPEEREKYENISIEMYYSDETIKRSTKDGKRLFFDNELKVEIAPGQAKKLIAIPPVSEFEFAKKVYSEDVEQIEDSSGNKAGISKTVFAELIYTEQEPFKDVDFSSFECITELIEKILKYQSL